MKRGEHIPDPENSMCKGTVVTHSVRPENRKGFQGSENTLIKDWIFFFFFCITNRESALISDTNKCSEYGVTRQGS